MSIAFYITLVAAILLGAAGVWDVYALFHGRETVSDVIRYGFSRWPVLPFLVGLALGHLLWN
jgi:hypothetical protein